MCPQTSLDDEEQQVIIAGMRRGRQLITLIVLALVVAMIWAMAVGQWKAAVAIGGVLGGTAVLGAVSVLLRGRRRSAEVDGTSDIS